MSPRGRTTLPNNKVRLLVARSRLECLGYSLLNLPVFARAGSGGTSPRHSGPQGMGSDDVRKRQRSMTVGVVQGGSLGRWFEELCRIKHQQLRDIVIPGGQRVRSRTVPSEGGVYAFWWTGDTALLRSPRCAIATWNSLALADDPSA